MKTDTTKGKMEPFPGWKFIFDAEGVAHHVPDKQLLEEMCKVYYGPALPTKEDIETFKQAGGIIG